MIFCFVVVLILQYSCSSPTSRIEGPVVYEGGYYVAGFGGSFTLVCDSSKLLEKLSEQSEENQLTQSEQSQLTQSERSQLTQSERNQQIKVEKRQLKFAEEVSQEELVEKKELKRKLLKKKKAEDNFEETERNVVISWDSDADIFSTKSRKDPEFEEYIEENRLIVHMYNITDQHVGNYFCNFTTQGEETQTTSQYVFVNGSTKMVVQDEYIRFFKYLERTDLNIPCRPTSPTIEVSLTLFSSPHEKITGLEFDPRVGFKSKNVSAGYHIYRCFYNSKGLREQSQLVNIQVLHIPPDRRGVAAPLVTAWNLTDGVQLQLLNKTLHVQEGNHVRLSCNATLESSNDLKLIWKKQKKVAEDQLEINKSSNYVTRDLVLENITEFDSATYSCFVLNPVGENNSYTINIEVKAEKPEYCLLRHVATSEKNVQEETLNGYSDEKSLTGGIKPSLNYKEYNQQNPSVDDCARIPAKVGERVNLSMIQTRSSVFYQLKWFNPSGEEQDCENSRSKLKYGCSRTTDNIDNIVVYIKKVELEDSGRYSFNCGHYPDSDPRATIHFCLEVQDKPRLTVYLDNPEFDVLKYSEPQDVFCKFTSNPPPNNILWELCQGPDYLFCSNYPVQDMLSNNGLDYTSRFTIWPEKLGWNLISIQCSGLNKINGSEYLGRSDRLIVPAVDYFPPVQNLLGYCNGNSEQKTCPIQQIRAGGDIHVYEKQSLFLFCGGHGLHSEKEVWSSDHGVQFKQHIHQGPSSFINKLLLDEIKLKDSGEYRCNNKSINILVKGLVPPVALDWDMDNSTMVVNISDKVVLNCGASGDPEPSLVWRRSEANHIQNLQNSSMDPLELDLISYNGSTLVIEYFHSKHVGTYTCIRESLAGKLVGFKHLIIYSEDLTPQIAKGLVGGFAFFVLCFFILFGSVIYYFRKHKMMREQLTQAEISLFLMGDPASINYNSSTFQDQVSLLPYDPGLEFPKERLKLGKQIGSGAFGRVLRAEALGIDPAKAITTVAVKTLKPQSGKYQIQALMSELKILSHLGTHPNVLNLLGAITTNLSLGELYMIVEYCKFGNLQKFIQYNRKFFIDQINPCTGKFDSNYPKDLASRLDISRGYNEKLNYASLCFENKDNNIPRPLTRENLEKHTVGNGTKTSTWCQQYLAEREEKNLLLHNALSVKDSGVSTDSDYPDGNTETSYITSTKGQGIEYCDVFPTYTKLQNKGETDDINYVHEFGPLTTRHLLSWCFQIAKGMEYLASKKIVHGDLAARNILLNQSGIVKISDFGLSKNIYGNPNYQKLTDTPLPIKWLALETLNYRIFSVQSDVWSYGVVLWEIFSLGRSPYPGVQQDHSFTQRLEQGHRMEKPEFSTNELYKVMLDCWHEDPSMRPSFLELTEKIHEEITEGLVESYLKLGDLAVGGLGEGEEEGLGEDNNGIQLQNLEKIYPETNLDTVEPFRVPGADLPSQFGPGSEPCINTDSQKGSNPFLSSHSESLNQFGSKFECLPGDPIQCYNYRSESVICPGSESVNCPGSESINCPGSESIYCSGSESINCPGSEALKSNLEPKPCLAFNPENRCLETYSEPGLKLGGSKITLLAQGPSIVVLEDTEDGNSQPSIPITTCNTPSSIKTSNRSSLAPCISPSLDPVPRPSYPVQYSDIYPEMDESDPRVQAVSNPEYYVSTKT